MHTPAQPLSLIPPDESQRIEAVRRYEILDTPPDGSFDRITALAARRFNVPISIISIVDHDRIWFKSHHGLAINEIGRDPGLCASAILSKDPHILTDAAGDIRSLANPLVAGEFGLRFYVGVPLRTSDGHNLGTLCIIDKEARPIEKGDIEDLKDLASVVMDQLELRLAARRAIAHAQVMAREIDHRVMNSLQFVAGLLSMQGRAATVPEAAEQLQIAANRVAAVARVHRHFYADGAQESVSCLTYLRRLCSDLSGILGADISVDGDDAEVPSARVQPIGLIVNELVINAAKHGAGKIHVAYRCDSLCTLSVCDEGSGLARDFRPEASTSGLGMKVVGALARQLGGTLSAGPNPAGRGACFTVTFPHEPLSLAA
jgi:two-component sensor histidine kinase